MATTTGTAVALAVWRRAGRLRTPLVGIVAGLLNRPWGRARRGRRSRCSARCTRCSTARAKRLASSSSTPARRSRAREPLRRGHPVLGAAERQTAQAAASRDRQRRASGLGDPRPCGALDRGADPHLDHAAAAHDLPENVSWEPADWRRRVLTDADVRSAFRSAAVVVVPVKDVPQPSGQSVTLQASACAGRSSSRGRAGCGAVGCATERTSSWSRRAIRGARRRHVAGARRPRARG